MGPPMLKSWEREWPSEDLEEVMTASAKREGFMVTADSSTVLGGAVRV